MCSLVFLMDPGSTFPKRPTQARNPSQSDLLRFHGSVSASCPGHFPLQSKMNTLPAATTAPKGPTTCEELRAVITTTKKLLTLAHSLTRTAEELHDKLPAILARLNEEAAEDNGSRAWWVVFVGRDPGIYDTLEAANVQIKGCPNQEYRRKGSKQEALAFYQLMYDNKQVEKWVEVLADN
ncbi:hypothetical protein B0H10DRAFT_1960681 [Mycena sp. CBHHK59/15]|nr:hypothetical protein B0H10DRAFT_1963653 [Mycena sp. CBHHK59/15]KAJ6591942.1 hypothetical protein B0H10DRAFT_1960681 [Mycena sp. CBHHK59/15]